MSEDPFMQEVVGCTPPCQNGGSCVELPMRYATPCYCPTGYTGRYCEKAGMCTGVLFMHDLCCK